MAETVWKHLVSNHGSQERIGGSLGLEFSFIKGIGRLTLRSLFPRDISRAVRCIRYYHGSFVLSYTNSRTFYHPLSFGLFARRCSPGSSLSE